MSPITDVQQGRYDAYIEKQEEERADNTSYGDVVSAAVSTTQLTSHVFKAFDREDMEPDNTWNVTPEEYDQLIEGIPRELHDEYNNSVSRAHAFQIRGELLDTLSKRDELMAHGVGVGVGTALVTSVLDPVAWGVTLATEGLAAPLLAFQKASRLQRIIKTGH